MIRRKILERIFCPFQIIEKAVMHQCGEAGIKRHPPVFIIGAPRCGSTLLYRLLVERYEMGFISNFVGKFYPIPTSGAWLARKLGISWFRGDYVFNFGRMDGLGAPSECGNFWYRWFPRGYHVYVGKGQTNRKTLRELRLQVGALSHVLDRPLVFKNLYNAMRIAPILESIPEASFIVCRRDYRHTALSILEARVKNVKSRNKWWSVPPKEFDELADKDYAHQVVGQVYYIHKQVEEDMRRFGSKRFLVVHYEDLCADVHGVLNRIKGFLASRGCRLNTKWEVPDTFTIDRVSGASPRDRELIETTGKLFFSADAYEK